MKSYNYGPRLSKLDSKYFDNLEAEFSEEDLVRTLATYMFDKDLKEMSEESYEMLQKIKALFGARTKDKVFYCLCYREHDT